MIEHNYLGKNQKNCTFEIILFEMSNDSKFRRTFKLEGRSFNRLSLKLSFKNALNKFGEENFYLL